MADASPFAAGFKELMALGYVPIPLIPADAPHGGRGKAPGNFKSGAWHGMNNWERFRDQVPTEFEHGIWARNFPGANMGVVMGTPAGDGLFVLAVDVDATDPDVFSEIAGQLPRSPMVKRGAKGETRFYRAAKEIRTKSYDDTSGDKRARLVDLLTGFDTRQTVVPPSIHPDGPVYAWTAGPVAADTLPEFTADDLEVLEECLSGLGWDPNAQRAGKTVTGLAALATDEEDFFTETKAAALANLPAWVPDLSLYDLRPVRGGYECVNTWRDSCAGRPTSERKRNLSIQANGIKDFGTNVGYSAIDLVMMARSCAQPEATAWLRVQLGLDDDGIVIALKLPEAAVEPFPGDLPAKAKAEPAPAPKPAPVRDDGELPAYLSHCPGLVGELTDWIVGSARRPQPGLSILAALSIVGAAAGRKYGGPTRSGTHLYALGLARTSAGKDHPLQCIPRVLQAAGMGAHVGPSQFMSMSALIKRMTRAPLTLSCIDEFGAFLARINGRKASTHERAITGILRSLWGSSFQSMSPPEWAGQTSSPIHSPSLTMYCVSTHEEFFQALEGGDVYNGFLNRFLSISTMRRPAEVDPTLDAHEVPEAIVAKVKDIYGAGGPLASATSHNDRAEAPIVLVPWADAQAKRAYQRMGEGVEAREGDMAFLARSVEMALRLATIRAIGICNAKPVITCEDMEWGRDLALWSAERMMADAADFMSANDHQNDANRVLRLVKEARRIKRRDLLRKLGSRIRARDLEDILKGLVEQEQITATKITPEGGGTPTLWYADAA